MYSQVVFLLKYMVLICTLTLVDFRRLTPIYEAAVLVCVDSVKIGARPRGLGPNCWPEQSESCKEKKTEQRVFIKYSQLM